MREVEAVQFRERMRALATRSTFRFPSDSIPGDFRRAAVLIVFWEEEGELKVLLTRRSSRMSRHAGQIAFPGGLLEDGEDWVEAALREAHEEVGLDPSLPQVLGRLDDAWSGARSHLVPVVAWLDAAPHWTRNPAEVDALLIAPVPELLRAEALEVKQIEVRGDLYTNSTLRWGEDQSVFGLTADLLLEALEWGIGMTPSRGEVRLRELRMYEASRARDASN